MPRSTRLDLPGVAQHVIQRGNNRQSCFLHDGDRRHYLGALREASLRYDCAIHAYVLMDNHVHLLMTPAQVGGLSRLMQLLGRNYVRYLNDRVGRTGTLWEGRYRAGPVDSNRYALACIRYIESNPVRAGVVSAPADFPWSSHLFHGSGISDPLVTPHESYLMLSDCAERRAAAYRGMLARPMAASEVEEVRTYARAQRALGSAEFRARVERELNRPADIVKRGRPRKSAGTQKSL